MADKLEAYRRKRDFGETPEPAGDADDAPEAARFVIQEHHATRLHWDLRLERDGALASWAVPNAIPFDPGDNRLAVRTEDHPLEYLTFHGEIPAGQYGAGTMTVWDRGTYVCEKWTADKVEVVLHGERVTGRYALFRLGREGNDWMIHRMDAPLDPARLPAPERLLPMQPRPGELPDDASGWGFEVSWDGLRALCWSDPGHLVLRDPDHADVTERFPEVRRLNRALSHHQAVLDGVLVTFGDDGRPDPERLERRLAARGDGSIRRLAAAIPATYVIVDLLHLDGHPLVERSYAERRAALAELRLDGPAWRAPAHHEGDGEAFAEAARAQGLRAVIAKRLDAPYEPGRRSDAWRRVRLLEAPATPARSGSTSILHEREVPLTNLDKVIFPKAGFTKGQMVDYYATIAPVLLPHLADRALTLKRYPNGVEGQAFYEKNCPSHRPPWVKTARIADIEYCLATDRPTLVWLAQLAAIELHTSLSRADERDRPTLLVFDLDPGPPAGLLECCELALSLHGMFGELGLRSLAKTSGSKGLQVYVPLNVPDVTYDVTKPFARAVAETLERAFPERVVSKMTKSLRPGKVLVDWSQNDRKKTTVCVYSLRARERPTVSTPLMWEEVQAAVDARDASTLVFEAADVLARVERHGDLFAEAVSLVQELPGG